MKGRPTPPMAAKPCVHPTCPNLTTTGRCVNHPRDRNLARDTLDLVARRDKYRCVLCGGGVDMNLRGTQAKNRPSVHHLNGTEDRLDNLALTHLDCNAAYG